MRVHCIYVHVLCIICVSVPGIFFQSEVISLLADRFNVRVSLKEHLNML